MQTFDAAVADDMFDLAGTGVFAECPRQFAFAGDLDEDEDGPVDEDDLDEDEDDDLDDDEDDDDDDLDEDDLDDDEED